MGKRERLTKLDKETGEYKEYIEIKQGDSLRTQGQKEYYFKLTQKYGDKTDFVWVCFKYNKPICQEIKNHNITRLMYLATFCNSKHYVMSTADIRGMLKLNANQLKDFKDELSVNKYIIFQEDKVFVNSNLFSKGKINTEFGHTRLFTETMHELYNSIKTTDHKQLAYIFKMLPYVNRQTNILSYNQIEQESKYIVYMSFKEFCQKINYDKTHISRLRKELLKFRINGELVIGFFDTPTELNNNGKFVIINPRLFFGGDRTTERYKAICKLFSDEHSKENNTPADNL